MNLLFSNVASVYNSVTVQHQEAKRLSSVAKELIQSWESKIDPLKKIKPTISNSSLFKSPSSSLNTSGSASRSLSSVSQSPKTISNETSNNASSNRPPPSPSIPSSNRFQTSDTALPKLGMLDKKDFHSSKLYSFSFVVKLIFFFLANYSSFLPRNNDTIFIDKTSSYYRNYTSNYLSSKLPSFNWNSNPSINARKPDLNEYSYTSSLENYVSKMDHCALESINKFLESIRNNGHTQTELPIKISDDILQQLVSENLSSQDIETHFISVDSLKELSQFGIDFSFLDRALSGTVLDESRSPSFISKIH